jgi:hypothetical protein
MLSSHLQITLLKFKVTLGEFMTTVFHLAHPHYAVHKAYVEGCFANPDNPPVVQMAGSQIWQNDSEPKWYEHRKYRLKPCAVTRTVTYPEPMRQRPDYGSTFWAVQSSRGSPVKIIWDGCSSDLSSLKNGMCFATEADAQACYDALFGSEK